MRAYLDISFDGLDGFDDSLEIIISKVGRGTRKGTIAACKEIMDNSLSLVPRFTGTLASSAFWEVNGSTKEGGFWGRFGYGENGNPINPISGLPASTYMVEVHENLRVRHKNGIAKFLEIPAREYAKANFPRTMFKNLNEELMR